MDSRQQSSGMTVRGELRLLKLEHTLECTYYVTELSNSELGERERGFPINHFGNIEEAKQAVKLLRENLCLKYHYLGPGDGDMHLTSCRHNVLMVSLQLI